jgi:hypothetical protein
MTTMSHSVGSSSVDRWFSSSCGVFRQKDTVLLGTGNGLGDEEDMVDTET